MAVTANLFRDRGDIDRQGVVVEGQPVEQFRHDFFVVGDQLPLRAPFGGLAEGVQRAAAQKTQFRDHAEQRHHPGSQLHLAQMAGHRVALGEQRRRHVEAEPVVAVELFLKLPAELAAGVEPGHFVLVLVGEQLVVIPCYRFGQSLFPRGPGLLRGGHPIHQLPVPLRVGGVLIIGEVRFPPGDDLLQAPRRGRLGGFRFVAEHLVHGGAVVGGEPPPAEHAQVGLYGGAVEFDRPLQRVRRDRNQPPLVGETQQKGVGADGVPHQPQRQPGGVDELGALGAAQVGDAVAQRIARDAQVRVTGKGAGHLLVGVDQRAGAARLDQRQHLGAGAGDQVGAEDQVGMTGPEAGDVERLRGVGDLQVAVDGAEFLRQTGVVERADRFAFHMGGGAEQRVDRHHPGSSDAPHQHGVGFAGVRQFRVRQIDEQSVVEVRPAARPLAQPAAVDGDKAGTEAVDARVVLVAGGLVDGALAAEFGLLGQH